MTEREAFVTQESFLFRLRAPHRSEGPRTAAASTRASALHPVHREPGSDAASFSLNCCRASSTLEPEYAMLISATERCSFTEKSDAETLNTFWSVATTRPVLVFPPRIGLGLVPR